MQTAIRRVCRLIGVRGGLLPARIVRMILSHSATRFWPAVFCMLAGIPPAHAQDAVSLQARHEILRDQMAANPYRRPIQIESSQRTGNLDGDSYALVEQPFAVAGPALQGMDHWCDILILHLNIKRCRASTGEAGDILSLSIGGKHDQLSTESSVVNFRYQESKSGGDYLQVMLDAGTGPLDTSDYRIVLEATAVDVGSTFLHLSYTYAYGVMARLAMQSYLATIGRNKVGFTSTGMTSDGEPIHIRGMRGVVERNTMRYYLAIEAYLGALSVPAPEQTDKRLNDWYTAIERYPQLHELERDEYLRLKHAELRSQHVPGPTAARN